MWRTLSALLSSPGAKGWLGETWVKWSSAWRLPYKIYRAVDDVTLPVDGSATQIDHVFVSRYGIFVVETKYMDGWICGNERDAQWTQKLNGRTFRFQNPLRQNYRHTKSLQAALNVPPDTIHSVIVFAGDAKIRPPVPDNVTWGLDYVSHIRSFNKPVLSETQIIDALARIEAMRLTPSRATREQHIRQLQARRCPRCGTPLIRRTAKRGRRAGKPFWGCSSFPKCQFTRNIT